MAPKDFFTTYAPFAIDTQIKYGVPASITLAQAALESGWGESGLTKKANNFFGIKADPSWSGPVINMATGEVFNGVGTTINSNFRKYASPGDSFNDHAKFLTDNKRYSNLFAVSMNDPYYYVKWAQGLKSDGYATALSYDTSLINEIAIYGLTKYDKEAISKKKMTLIAGVSLVIIVIIGTLYLLFKKDK